MEELDDKRKRSEEGLLGLLGTYASDEDEDEAPLTASPKKQKTDQSERTVSPKDSKKCHCTTVPDSISCPRAQ